MNWVFRVLGIWRCWGLFSCGVLEVEILMWKFWFSFASTCCSNWFNLADQKINKRVLFVCLLHLCTSSMNLINKKTFFKPVLRVWKRIGEVGDVMGCRDRLTGGYMGVYVCLIIFRVAMFLNIE